jgi:hypothetical protein
MKKLLVTLTATLVCVGAFAQGKLAFALNTTGIIYFTTDTTHLLPADNKAVAGYQLAGSGAYGGTSSTIASLAGSPAFTVALYGGASAGSLSLLTTTTIATYGAEGQIVQANTTFASLAAGTPAFFQIQVFDGRAANTAAAWLTPNPSDPLGLLSLYAGESAVFSAVPQASAYSPIYQAGSPVNSTLGVGAQNILDYPGAKGLIGLQAVVVPEPATFALAGLGLAALVAFRRRS